jgi:hypothetical protein
MRNRLIGFGFVMVVLAVAATGCGGSSGNIYSCNFAASAGLCYDYSSAQPLPSAQVTQLQTACTTGGAGTFSTSSTCPSASRVGSCALTNTQMSGVTVKYVFYSPAYTAATGQQFCTSLTGTWTAG